MYFNYMKEKISRYLSVFVKKKDFLRVLTLISYLLKDGIIPPKSVELPQCKLGSRLKLDLNC